MLSGVLKLILTFPDPWGQRFQSYSLGHFREVTLQDSFWRPIAPKPMHKIQSTAYQRDRNESRNISVIFVLKKNDIFYVIYFSFFCQTPFPKKVFYCISKFDHLSWAEKKNWRGVLSIFFLNFTILPMQDAGVRRNVGITTGQDMLLTPRKCCLGGWNLKFHYFSWNWRKLERCSF